MNCNLTGKIECFTNTCVQCTVIDTHCYLNVCFFHPIPKKESVSHLESESVCHLLFLREASEKLTRN